MNKTELTAVLEDAGLSPYQAEAYVTVLELGSASATDIAEASDVPDPRIYDVLRDLEKQGYNETYEQDSLHARAYSPTEVLDDLRSRATKFEDAADEIESRWEEPSMDTHTVSFVKRVDTVLEKAEALIRTAESQIQIAVSPEQYDRLKPALEAAKADGVHVRLAMYVEEGVEPPKEQDLASVATEVRYRRIPMPFIALIDRTATCFAPHNLSMNRYGIIVEDRAHAYVFHWFFMAALWESTMSLYADDNTALPRTYVDIRNCIRDVAPLLNDGATINATVEALDVDTGRSQSLSGQITGVRYNDQDEDETPTDIPFVYLGGEAALVLECDGETFDIGGWGAVIEDYEATRVVVEEIVYQ